MRTSRLMKRPTAQHGGARMERVGYMIDNPKTYYSIIYYSAYLGVQLMQSWSSDVVWSWVSNPRPTLRLLAGVWSRILCICLICIWMNCRFRSAIVYIAFNMYVQGRLKQTNICCISFRSTVIEHDVVKRFTKGVLVFFWIRKRKTHYVAYHKTSVYPK